MKTKSRMKLSWKALIALTLTLSFMSTSSATSIYASPNAIETDSRRLTMLGIAEQYANYTWTATSDNVWHASTSSYGSGQTSEPPNPPHPIVNENDPNPLIAASCIDTPNLGWPYDGNIGWWKSDGSVNRGVPYAWGGATTIDKVYLPTGNRSFSFDEKLSYGYPAGDITTPTIGTCSTGTYFTNGVDCVGFINRVWNLGGTWYGMDNLKGLSHPIKFRELRTGDILMYYEDHVTVHSLKCI